MALQLCSPFVAAALTRFARVTVCTVSCSSTAWADYLLLLCVPCVDCSFSSFGFKWPTILSKMYNIASMTSFNEQFLAPECSVGGWSFQLKCVASSMQCLYNL